MLFGRITEMMKHFIQMELSEIHTAVDATMGNGNDTLFLSQFVGEKGQVYGFDIQKAALEATGKRLQTAGADNVTMIHDGHEKMAAYVEEADLIMFNLGYLPKGDHSIITTAETTLRALSSGLGILNKGGLLTIIAYYGHEGGFEEKEDVQTYLKSLDQYDYDVLEVSAFNKDNNPPIIYIVRKK